MSSFLSGFQLLEDRDQLGNFLRACAAELVGTFAFTFLGTGAVVSACHVSHITSNGSDGSGNVGACFFNSPEVLLDISFAFGLALFVVIYFTALISGGHINPAVSLAVFLTKQISLCRSVCFILLQLCGASVASGFLKLLDPHGFHAAGGAANKVNHANGETTVAAFGFEAVLTFFLILVVLAAIDVNRSTHHIPILAPLGIGMVVLVAHLIAVPVDGCSLNPARSFGPAVVMSSWVDQWVFWVGPLTGALVASLLYTLIFASLSLQKMRSNLRKTWKRQGALDQEAHSDLEKGISLPHEPAENELPPLTNVQIPDLEPQSGQMQYEIHRLHEGIYDA